MNPLSGRRVDVDAPPLRRVRPLCAECQRRPAVTCVRGRRVVLDDHDMCRQCWRARMDARRPTRRGESVCAHDWQPISGWYARYRCSSCHVIGCKLGVVDPSRGRGAEIEPYRCEVRRGGERCSEPAVYARRGKGFRCAAHRRPGPTARARSELAAAEGAGAIPAGEPARAPASRT